MCSRAARAHWNLGHGHRRVSEEGEHGDKDEKATVFFRSMQCVSIHVRHFPPFLLEKLKVLEDELEDSVVGSWHPLQQFLHFKKPHSSVGHHRNLWREVIRGRAHIT